MILFKHEYYGDERDSGLILGKRLGCKIVNAGYNIPDNDLILNWGVSGKKEYNNFINSPVSVARAVNKLTTLKVLQKCNVPCLDFCERRSDAQEILNTSSIYVRKILSGSKGHGIIYLPAGHLGRIPLAKLYTVEFPSDREFRVHILFGNVVDITEKINVLRTRYWMPTMIRSYDNGWVFKRYNSIPKSIAPIGAKAIAALDLEFGAVDVLYDSGNDEAVVCEVNTAPGIIGDTLKRYVYSFKQFINSGDTDKCRINYQMMMAD